jgi:hypothetical protein
MSGPPWTPLPISGCTARQRHTFLENPRPETAHFAPSLIRLCYEHVETETLQPRQAVGEGKRTTKGTTSGDNDG